MLLLKIYRYLMGYIRFAVYGDYPERLINLINQNGISCWDILRSDDKIEMCMLVKDYKKLRFFRQKSRCRTRCKAKYGLPFYAVKYKKRAGILVGAAVFFIMLWFLSGRIWNIEIRGEMPINEQDILAACREVGVFEGASKKAIDIKGARVKLALLIPDVAWASVNIEGSVATVELSPVKTAEINDGEPSNLKAACDGVISGMQVIGGKPAVKVGDGVAKGNLLVSGVIEYPDGTGKFVRSRGKIMAQTEHKFEYFATYVMTERVVAKTPRVRRVLNVFSLRFPLYIGSVKGKYIRYVSDDKITCKNRYAPIYLTTEKFYGVTERTYVLTSSGAESYAKSVVERMQNEAFAGADIEVLSFSDKAEVRSDGVAYTRMVKCVENIAVEEKIIFGTLNQ